MLRVKRTHRWMFMAVAALLSSGYVMDASAAINPWRGNCKPVSEEEVPAAGKEKAPKPANGSKSERPAGEKPVKGQKMA
jgi:hypothetical protein